MKGVKSDIHNRLPFADRVKITQKSKFQGGGKIVPVKKNWATREIPPVKFFLLPVNKTEKTRKSAREKRFPRVKKMEKMGKNGFHGHF